ncbi:2578_t:CDS:2, partial [Ambispora leptoticha]
TLKYPDDDSQTDVWLLPSGKSVKDIIHGPANLHESQRTFMVVMPVKYSIHPPPFTANTPAKHFWDSSMIHPILQYLMNATDSIYYVPGEIHLRSSANQQRIRRNLKPEDDIP